MAAKNEFDQFDNAPANAFDAFDDPATAPQPAGTLRRVADTGLALGRGIIGVPEAAVGVSNLMTGGRTGKAVERLGVRFKDAKQILTDAQSDQQKAADAAVQQADGFLPTVGAMVENPSTIVNAAAESAPSMLAGGALSQKLVNKGVSAITAGAAGEGIVSAGQAAEQVRQEGPTGFLTPKQAALAATSGAVTGVINRASGRLADKLGIGDVNTAMATGKLGGSTEKGVARRAAYGAVNEGVLQELPQSAQEQAMQNLALDKPVGEGVAQAAASGMLVGNLTGGAFGAVTPPSNKNGTLPGAAPNAQGGGNAPLNAGVKPPSIGSTEIESPGQSAPTVIGGQAAPTKGVLDVGLVGSEGAGNHPKTKAGFSQSDGLGEGPGELTSGGLDGGSVGVAQGDSPSLNTQNSTVKPPADKASAIGINRNEGPLSSAAATAVDTGADVVTQQQEVEKQKAEAAAKEKTKPGADGKKPEPEAPAPVQPAPADPTAPITGPFTQAIHGAANVTPTPAPAVDPQGAAAPQGAGAQPDAPTAPGVGVDQGPTGAGAVPAAVPEPVQTPAVTPVAPPTQENTNATQQASPGESIDPETGEITQSGAQGAGGDGIQRPADALDPGADAKGPQRTLDQPAAPAAARAATEGKPAAPTAPLDLGAHTAATSPHNDRPEPTQAQKEAGNAKLGHIVMSGLGLSIENPEGSTRRSKPDSPVKWETTMKDGHYGYVKGSIGMDGDHVDTFIKPGTPLDHAGTVFVIDQVDPATGKPDEHKVMIGYPNGMAARQAYQGNYQKGWKGFKAITPMAWDEFKTWVKSEGTKSPAARSETALVAPPPADTPVATGTTSSAVDQAAQTPAPTQAATPSKTESVSPAAVGPSPDGTPDKTAGKVAKPTGGRNLRAAAYEKNPLLTFLAKHGLFHDKDKPGSQKAEFSPDRQVMVMGYGPVFRKTGMKPDLLTQLAIEDGYLPPDADESQLVDLIRRAIGGEKIVPMYAQGAAETEMQKRMQAIDDLRELDDNEAADLDPDMFGPSNTSAEDAMRAMGFTEQEIHDATTQGPRAPQEGGQGRGEPDEAQAAAAPGGTQAGPGAPEGAGDRFAAGRALTKEQRKQVLGTLVDVYKAKGAPREQKGVGRDGNERYGYVHSPDLFEKSDITGAAIRYYVKLPDGRLAHPTELFPDYTQAEIDTELQRRETAEKADADNQQNAEANFAKYGEDTKAGANQSFFRRNAGFELRDWRNGKVRHFVHFQKDGKFYATVNDDEALMARLERAGWSRDDGLTAPTRAEILEQQAKAEAERQRQEQGGDAPLPGKKVTGDTPDMFNTQGSVFDQPESGESVQEESALYRVQKRGQQAPGKEVPTSIDEVSSVASAFEFAAGKPFRTNRDFKLALQDRVVRAAKALKLNLWSFSAKTEDYLVRMVLADARQGLKNNSNAVGWYNEKVTKALRILALIHPELATDRKARFAFTWALAVTSNGQKVNANFKLAEAAYFAYKASIKTGKEGIMPTNLQAGTAQAEMNMKLGLFNKLLKSMGFDALERLMTTKDTVSNIEALSGEKVGGENKTTVVYGAAILGPKIGNGFFANLYGHFEQLTMDRWLMRTWGRWTGTLVTESPEQVKLKRMQMRALIDKLTPEQKRAFEAVIGSKLKVSDPDATGMVIFRKSTKKENRDAMAEIGPVELDDLVTLDEILGEAKDGITRMSYGDEIRKIGNALTKYLDGQKEAPTVPERSQIRKVFARALTDLQKDMPELTMADLQATLWYPEKRLYDSAKMEEAGDEEYEDDAAPDYANAAAQLARDKGVPASKIARAIAAVDSELQAAKRAAGVRPGGGGPGAGGSVLDGQGEGGNVREVDAPYETDLFGQPVPAATGRTGAARPAGAGVRGNLQPATGVQDTPAPRGEYFANTLVGSEASRELGASRITKPEHAAQATAYLYRSAVERLDGIVTDKNGKPLGIVGGFKGALSQASVYPATLMAEAVRIPGAARIWFSHNHPSGNPQMSRADENLNRVLSDVFRGSGIEPMGLLAIGNGRFSFAGQSATDMLVGETIANPTSRATVPVIERTLGPGSTKGPAISSPAEAKRVAKDFYARAKEPGVLLMDAQNTVIAWVPITSAMMGELRGTGQLNAIYRAISQANAGSAIIVHGGELGYQSIPKKFPQVTPSENIAAALKKVDVQPLDSIDVTMSRSVAETGDVVAKGPMFSRKWQGPFYSALSKELEGVNAGAQPALGWANTINGLVKAGKVKQDEVTWSGVLDWLKLQEGKVTREQVVQFLDANGVKVEETVLAGPGLFRDVDEAIDYVAERYAMTPEEVREEYGYADEQDYIELARSIVDDKPDQTKYGRYQLPGGTNYREVLLTLPAKEGRAWVDRAGNVRQWINDEPTAEVRSAMEASGLTLKSMPLTDSAGTFKSGHWDQPNILAHIRVNDRTDTDGRKVLFVEEIQSDWGQAGKKQGFDAITPKFVPQVAPGERRALIVAMTEAFRDKLVAAGVDSATATTVAEKTGHDVLSRTTGMVAEYQDLLAREDSDRQAERASKIVGIPSAPFVTKTDAWLSLAIKRIVKMAADGGYDRVAFVNGEQSAERYDLSKQVRSIVWTGRGNDTEKRVTITPNDGNDIEFMVQPDGAVGAMGRGSIGNEFDGKRLDDIVGKDVAERIMGDPYGDMRGNGLKVGGEGMKAFYDRIVPNTLKDVLKKVGGGALETVGVQAPYRNDGDRNATVNRFREQMVAKYGDGIMLKMTTEERQKLRRLEDGGITLDQPGFTITPAMQEKAANGLPLFDRKAGQTGGTPAQKVRLMAAPIAKRLHIDLRVVDTPAGLPIPAPSDAVGLYNNGTIWLVAGNIKTRQDIMQAIAHEAVAHLGLRQLLEAPEYRQLMSMINAGAAAGGKLAQIQAEIRQAYVDQNGRFNLNPMQEADEIAARVAELGVDTDGNFRPGFEWLKDIFARVVQWLRAKGLDVPFTNTELQGMLVRSQAHLERGPEAAGQMGAAFSRAFPQNEIKDAIQRWTGADVSKAAPELVKARALKELRAALRDDKMTAEDMHKLAYNWLAKSYEYVPASGQFGNSSVPSAVVTAMRESIIKRAKDGKKHDAIALPWGDKFTVVIDGRVFGVHDTMEEAEADAADMDSEFWRGEIFDVDGNDTGNHPKWTEDARFMRKPTAADAIQAATERAGNTAAHYRSLGLQALGRRQIVELYGKLIPQLPAYSQLMAQMDADKNEAGAEADQIAQDWGKLKDDHPLAELMHDATLAQMDPAMPLMRGDDPLTYDRLRDQFVALSPEARTVYVQARDTYRTHHENVRKAIRERIERSELRGQRKAELLKQMDDEFYQAIKGVYFPLARFGDYVVVVRDGTGKAVSVNRAESINEAQALQIELRKAYPDMTVGKVLKSKEFNAGRDAVGRGFMQNLYEVLGKKDMDEDQRAELEDMLGQLYLSALPDLSWAKHGIHRKGTPGFSQDARRAFAQNTFHGARYLAKVRYSDLLENELTDAQKQIDGMAESDAFDSVKAQQVIDEMVKRHDAAMNPSGNAISTALTSMGFVFHLGLSPASALVNLTQTALVAYPLMGAKWGFAKASTALLKASQQAAANKNDISTVLSDDEKQAYDEAVRSGVIDVTMAHDLAGISQGEDAKVSWKLRPVMRWASFLFHHAEKFNRQVTFIAAYRLAREAGSNPVQSYEQAVKATYDGHFDYSASNRPRLMQGNAARVLLLFKQYGQNMVYTLSRQAYLSMKGQNPYERAQARKALGGLLAMHAAAAGVLGLPMVSTLLAAASMLGGDDDEPWDAEVALRNMLADMLGDQAADVLARGLSRLTPWDISGRVGLDKLILPDIQEGLEGQDLANSAMAAALGPVAGIGISMLKGLHEISDGNWARGLEAMAPSLARGPLKALRYGTEGAIDKTGKPIVEDVGVFGIAGQALGFSPSEVRLATEAKSAVHQADERLSKRRATLMRHYAMAVIAGDVDGAADAREDIAAFNEKNPQRRINPLQMAKSVATRRKQIAQSQGGVYLPKNHRDAMQAGQFGMQ